MAAEPFLVVRGAARARVSLFALSPQNFLTETAKDVERIKLAIGRGKPQISTIRHFHRKVCFLKKTRASFIPQ
jgi:hypothetical protein